MRRKIIAGVVCFICVFTVTSLAISAIEKNKKKEDLFRQVELFSDCLAIVQSEYVEEPEPKKLIYGALSGMLSSLDPHSQFMDPDAYNDLKVDTQGRFGGLGIEIAAKDGLLTVITPIEDTPAWKAGIKSGDIIVKIDNEVTRDMPLAAAVKKMRGNPGEPISLSILREPESKIMEFKLVRDVIKIKDVKEAKILEGHTGYIRLVEFRENTLSEFNLALDNLIRQGMDALILDLRNNPGGLLDAAVSVTEKFIASNKLILYTKGRKTAQNMEYFSRNARPLGLALVILINEGSASGSEIVAGCLKDYNRAVIMGVKSFGKGSVQTVIPLSDGSALRLTTSKYFTPLGKEIHNKGVQPDIEVKEEAGSEAKPGAEDKQLLRAVDALKALKIYKNK